MKLSQMPYEHVDLDRVKAFFEQLITDSKNAGSGEELFELHKKYYEFIGDVYTNIKLGRFRHDIDTSEEFYTKENDYIDEISPVISNLSNDYSKVLYESPYREYLEEKISKVAFKNIELANKSIDEKILPLMQEENALMTTLLFPPRFLLTERSTTYHSFVSALQLRTETQDSVHGRLFPNTLSLLPMRLMIFMTSLSRTEHSRPRNLAMTAM